MSTTSGGVIVAVDPGQVRLGVAASDPGQILASPISTLPADQGLAGVVAVVLERSAVAVVVGLPLGLSGGEGASAAAARAYAGRLADALHAEGPDLGAGSAVPVFLVDERLTTVAASTTLQRAGHDSRSARRVVDQAAATALLQGVLDAAAARGVTGIDVLEVGLGERVSAQQ